MSRRLRIALFGTAIVLLVFVFVAYREGRQREMDRDLVSAIYGVNPDEVARLLRLGADPNSRLGARRFTWFSRVVLRLQGNPLWNDPRIDQAGCLLVYVDQKRSSARSRIGRIMQPHRSATSNAPATNSFRISNLRSSEERLGRIRDLLIEYGAHR